MKLQNTMLYMVFNKLTGPTNITIIILYISTSVKNLFHQQYN